MYIPIHILRNIIWRLPVDIRLDFKLSPKRLPMNLVSTIRNKLIASPTIRIAVVGDVETPNYSMEIIFVRKNVLKTYDTPQDHIDTSQLFQHNPHPIFQVIEPPERLVHFSIYRLTCGEFQYYWNDYASLTPEFINVIVQPLTKIQFPIVKYETPFTFFIYRFYD